MSILKGVKKKIDNAERRMQAGVFSKAARRKPLKIQRDILDEIEERIELRDRTGPIFPYNYIVVSVLADDVEHKTALEAVLLDDSSLEDKVRTSLREAGVTSKDKVEVDINIVDKREQNWRQEYFHIEFHRRTASRVSEVAKTLDLIDARITVVRGRAMQKRYSIKKSRFNIGRLRDVTDSHGRIIRRNDLVFVEKAKDLADGDREINKTVAREHAHIEFDQKSGALRLCADRGEGVTRIFRKGSVIKVARFKTQGARLQTDDEIYLGQARLAFEIKSKELNSDDSDPSSS